RTLKSYKGAASFTSAARYRSSWSPKPSSALPASASLRGIRHRRAPAGADVDVGGGAADDDVAAAGGDAVDRLARVELDGGAAARLQAHDLGEQVLRGEGGPARGVEPRVGGGAADGEV